MATIEYKADKLSATNYSTWKIIIRTQLKSRDLWKCITELKNETDEERQKHEQAKHIMYVAMEPSQIAATGTCESARDLWIKIKENHEGAETNLRNTSLAEFLGLKYYKNETVINFAGRFELALGTLLSTGHTVDEKTKLWVFSNSLPANMQTTVQMYQMANPDGKVSELISQLKIQHHYETNSSHSESTAYQARERYNDNKYNSKNYTKTGPRQTNESYNRYTTGNDKKNMTTANTKTCTFCKKIGHIWRECRQLKSRNEQKNQKIPHPETGKEKSGAFMADNYGFSQPDHYWIVDSGASSHITPHRQLLTNYTQLAPPCPITVGDGKVVYAYGSGNLPFESNNFIGELKNVLWVPKIAGNLFSVIKALEQNCDVRFSNKDGRVNFYKNKKLVLQGNKETGSPYFFITIKPLNADVREGAMVGASLNDWHRRFGHCPPRMIRSMVKNKAVKGIEITDGEEHQCKACILGKMCRVHHPSRRELEINEATAVVHLDTVGPMKTTSLGGSRFFVLGTEQSSNYKIAETVGHKSSIPDKVKLIINKFELTSGKTVKSITTDNGSEFNNLNLRQWIEEKGIIHNFSVTHTPQQNGTAERNNRSILDGMRTLLADSELPEDLWAEALQTTIYTSNRTPSSKSIDKTRFELLRKEIPDVSNLRIFGQRTIVREPDTTREGKLAPRGIEMIFVGYTERHNTYRLYREEPVRQVIEACDVKFIHFTNRETTDNSIQNSNTLKLNIADDEDLDNYDRSVSDSDGSIGDTVESLNAYIERRKDDSTDSDSEVEVRRPYTRSQRPQETARLTKERTNETAMFTLLDEPTTVEEAKSSENWSHWKSAMHEEMKALIRNKTWTLVDRPPGVKPIKNKWVFKTKLKQDGTVDRFKARLVAKGYTQIENVDYKETYAPVASMSTVRLFLAVANQRRMNIIQFDIKTAFLNGDLEEVLYMEQPAEYVQGNKVCKLTKSLYGLKQAPRQWNRKFDDFLKQFNLIQGTIDRCLYYNEEKTLLLAIYVDDGLAAGSDPKELNGLLDHLRKNFDLKTMDCETFLGFKITRDTKRGRLSISQPHYIERLLTKFGMYDSKPTSTPEHFGNKFTDEQQLPTDNQFKELVGSLLYLVTCSRPDISHAVSMASRTSAPTQGHWIALKRILRYLKGTANLGITYEASSKSSLVGYSDADFANDTQSRKSTTGYCIEFGHGLVSWKCQRQSIVTLSTTEAEYVAGCELVKELIPMRQQLIEIGEIEDTMPCKIYIDNQSAVKIACNESGQVRTKHIDIRQKWLNEQVREKRIIVEHIRGTEQKADILTKPLQKTKFQTNRNMLMSMVLLVSVMLTIANGQQERSLKLTDVITTVPSDYKYITGDTRYKLTNIFVNPCEVLFNYSTSITATEILIRHCFNYYEKKVLGSLPNCKQTQTIGSDLSDVPASYDCVGNYHEEKDPFELRGRCEVSRRQTKQIKPLDAELDRIEESWQRHKQAIQKLPKLRTKRVIPLLLAGAATAVVSIMAGSHSKTVKMVNQHSGQIESIGNVTDIHSELLKQATDFFDQYRDSVSAIHSWAQEVEERLGNDPVESRLNNDPLYRGKKASLVRTYMNWFEAQEKLLHDINWGAANKKVPLTLKTMVNLTHEQVLATNWSTLLDCQYHIENKNMVLNLDFIIPTVENTMEILEVVAMNYYKTKQNDSGIDELCWNVYNGPHLMLHNKTNDCMTDKETYFLHETQISIAIHQIDSAIDTDNEYNSHLPVFGTVVEIFEFYYTIR